jgi:hypothetical protein
VSLNAVENNNAQNEGVTPRIPTKEEIEDYKKSSDFNYERVYQQDQSWWDDFKKWLKDLFNELFDFPEVKSFDYWEAIMWVLITIAVLAIIYFGFRNEIAAFWGKRNVKSSTAIKTDFVDLTEDTITLETKLQNAIAQKEYAEAIRLYYTISLKSLIDAGLVEFRIDKTNSEYLFEIPTNTIRQPFKQLTFYFDYIFYGEFEATENIFLKTQEQYNILATHLKKAPTH